MLVIPLDQIDVDTEVVPDRALVDSIRENGQIVPVIVANQDNGRYRLVAGYRRYFASKIIGREVVFAEPAASDDNLSVATARLLENMARSPHPAMEAQAIGFLIDNGLTAQEISKRLGVPLRHVQERVKLLELPPALLAKVAQGKMPLRAAQTALTLPPDVQEELAAQESVTISQVQALKRALQMKLLALDNLAVPSLETTGQPYAELSARLAALARGVAGWRRQALLEAVQALESADDAATAQTA